MVFGYLQSISRLIYIILDDIIILTCLESPKVHPNPNIVGNQTWKCEISFLIIIPALSDELDEHLIVE
jgi:hypothetical protein